MGFGFRVWVLGFGVIGLGLRVLRFGCRLLVLGFWFRVLDLGFCTRVLDLGSTVEGLRS